MTYVLWNEPFYVDPTTGEAYADNQPGTIPVPKYGNYGGAFSDPNSFPSITSELAGSNEMEQAAADIKLISSLTFFDSSYSADPEATLYALT